MNKSFYITPKKTAVLRVELREKVKNYYYRLVPNAITKYITRKRIESHRI